MISRLRRFSCENILRLLNMKRARTFLIGVLRTVTDKAQMDVVKDVNKLNGMLPNQRKHYKQFIFQ